MDGFRCFTWDKERFPDPAGLVESLAEDGFKTVAIIDPGIKIYKGYHIFQQGIEGNHFCRRADGPLLKGKVWPGDCHFPDFTNSRTRDWWSGLYKELIKEIGLAGIWNDMNEPALFEVESKTFPLDVRHDYDGQPCSHRKAHNIYGMQMARATLTGVKRFAPERRPLVITRSGYAGLQRYCSTWTGDNLATWRHLWLANVQCQRLAVSGVSFAGSDVGGFVGQPTAELFERWVQMSIFHPFFRNHSSGDHGEQEPWSFGEKTLDKIRIAIELRYRLLPYIYTTFFQYCQDGSPMVRPLAFVSQGEAATVHRSHEFMLGDSLLIAPVHEAGLTGMPIYLPEGEWHNYHNNNKIKGGKVLDVEIDEESIPLFVKSGTVLPHFPVMQYVGEKPLDSIELKIYCGEGGSGFYHDAGDGYDYVDGGYRLAHFQMEKLSEGYRITQTIKGHFQADFSHYILDIQATGKGVRAMEVDGQPWVGFRIPADFTSLLIIVNNDLAL
jgi:alpha-glucosidase